MSIDNASEKEWNSLNNGGTTDYYNVPAKATTLNDLIDHVDMSWNMANIFKACYRFGRKSKTAKLYDLNKIIYYAQREISKLNSSYADDRDI